MENERYNELDMMELTSKLVHLLSGQLYQSTVRAEGEDNYKKKVIELVNKLNEKNFEEEKIDQAVRRLIQDSKAELMEIIRLESGLEEKQKQALAILNTLRSEAAELGRNGLNTENLSIILYNANQLSNLLEQQIPISRAMEKVSQKLDNIMKTIRKEE